MGVGYSWLHAYLLYLSLLKDLSSWSGAVFNGLKWPQDRATGALAALYNLTLSVNTDKKAERVYYPNPFPDKDVVKTGTPLSRDAAKEIFKKMNSNLK
jgi:hypothetical protein